MGPSAAPRPVERVPLPAPRDFYRTYARRALPVIFTGGMSAWPASSTWSLDWFEATHGDVVVPVHAGIYRRAEAAGVSEKIGPSRLMTLGEYIRALRQGRLEGLGYLAGGEVFQILPSLLKDVPFPEYAPLERLTSRSFWMGAPGTLTKLHVDKADNLYAQLVGRKQWRLYHPDKGPAFEGLPDQWASIQSGLDIDGGFERLAGQGILPDYEFTIEPGELLYVPYGWWHRVLTLELTIAANLWWWTVPMVMRRGHEALFTSLWLWRQRSEARARRAA